MHNRLSYSVKVLSATAAKWFAVGVVMLALQGCLSTSQPTFPTELQMIIAQSKQNQTQNNAHNGAQNHNQNNGPQNASNANKTNSAKAISIEQLMASIRARSDVAKTNQQPNQQTNQQAQNKTTSTWTGVQAQTNVATAKTVKAATKRSQPPADPQAQQIQLNYPKGKTLPYPAQLLLLKQLATEQNLLLVSIAIGPSAGKSPIDSVSNAQKRSQALLKQLAVVGPKQPKLKYQPGLDEDLAVVTFTTTFIKGQR